MSVTLSDYPPVDPIDELNDAIRVAGARGSVGTRLEAGGAWGYRLDAAPWAALHVVLAGSAWLDILGDWPRRLDAGDVVWIPPHMAHGLSARPGVDMGPCDSTTAEQARLAGTAVRVGQPPALTRLLTLHYLQDPEVSTPAVVALTEPMILEADAYPSLLAIGELLDDELSGPQLGTTAAVNSLVDLFLVRLIRAGAIRGHNAVRGGHLTGTLDPITRDALRHIHQNPECPWTTDSLARTIGVSRPTLARRFAAAIGQAPGAYLTSWRMDLATIRLRDTDEPVESVARSVGYGSPHAFSRAFRRQRGQAPTEYRASVRSADSLH